MSRVRSRDTVPERTVRCIVTALGYRYRLNVKALPGHPDLVFRNRKKVIFVHGCFWHRHKGCALARLPKSRTDFGTSKFEQNRVRDLRNVRAIRKSGWHVLVVWECELKVIRRVTSRIGAFIDAER